MKKFILLYPFIISIHILYGQELELPKYTAASPEAASLGKYGDVPINLAIGQINYTIPLYTIKVGDFEFPLTLSYGYSGFKPDTDPTMVGMGWTANFGGAIVRQVKGSADDVGGYRVNSFYLDQLENYDNLNNTAKVELLKKVVDDNVDLRPDIYIINTPNLSGKFRIKPDESCIFSQQRNYKITVGNNFELVDDNGVLYKFNNQERTSLLDLASEKSEDINYTSSWMISQIKIPNGRGNLDFTYTPSSFRTQTWAKIITRQLLRPGHTTTYSEMDNSIATQIINRIDFPGGYVKFITDPETIEVTTSTQELTFNYVTNRVKLQYLAVYNSMDQLVSKYVFDYYHQGYYYFLKSIVKEDEQGNQEDYYSFGYYDLDKVPEDRVSNNRIDMWGFYNGKDYRENDQTYSLSPSFTKGRIGALKQITYPTKGTTTINYEAHDIKRSVIYQNDYTPEVYNKCETLYVVMDETQDDFPMFYQEFEIPYNQKVEVTLTAEALFADSKSFCGLKDANKDFVQYNNNGWMQGISLGADEDSKFDTKTLSIYLTKGTYYLYAEIQRGEEDGNYAKIEVKYRDEPYSQDPVEYKMDVGGIRVAKTIDNPSYGQEPIIHNYKYIGDDNKTSGYLIDRYVRYKSLKIKRIFKYARSILPGLNGEVINLYGCGINSKEYVEYTESLYPMSPLTALGSHIQYSQVVVESNDGTNGRTIKKFSGDGVIAENRIFPDLISDYGYKHGKLTKEEIYRYGEGTPRQSQQNNYEEVDIDQSNYIADYQIMRYPEVETWSTCDGFKKLHTSTVETFKIGSLKHCTKAYRNEYTSVVQKENNGNISTRTNYTYDPQTGYPIEIATSNSEGKTIKNKTYYPKNCEQLSGLDQPLIDMMLAQNMLSSPIQTEKLVETGGSLLSKTTQRTAFKDWGDNPDNTGRILLPEYIQTSKGTAPLEDRILFHDYYSNGNVKEVSKTNDLSVYYIWGYQDQYPIAKIENFTSSEAGSISDLINTAISASNNDNDRTIGTSGSEGALRTALNNIRNNVTLQNALITTYTYDPLIGMTSVTDPNGKTSYYDYDNFGRLKVVKDDEGKLLQTYEYHYNQ
jgi:YD repeat-containing protein